MSAVNNCQIIGRLTKDVASAQTGETTVARTTVAVQRSFKDKDGNYEADFISVFAFGKTAEFLEKFFKKGDPVIIRGNIRTGSYTNKDGQKVYTTEVAIDEISFVPGSKKSEEEPKTETKKTTKKKTVNVEDDDDFMTISEEEAEDLPF